MLNVKAGGSYIYHCILKRTAGRSLEMMS